MSPSAPDGRALAGRVVRLEVRRPTDTDALFAALDDDRVWAGGYGGGPSGRPDSPAGLRAMLDAVPWSGLGGRVQYVVRTLDTDRVVGTSTLGDIDLANRAGHVGWTAYAPHVWGTAVNPECKLLLLGHGFDDCGLERIKIQTDANLNQRSMAAIAKLGAHFEGIVRHHRRRADGTWRDTAMYSILRSEWPLVRRRLEERIDAHQP